MLLRFRQYKYAITADIEAMYHQVKIPTKDRNALRFLWQDEDGSKVEYRMTSHLFGGVWCASSSTYALRKIVQDTRTDELVTDTICRSFYADDMLRSVRTREEAADVIRGTKQELKYGGFNLTKYVVNDTQLLQSIDVADRAKEVKEITPEMYSKALGIRWDVNEDEFYYVSGNDRKHGGVTRRCMLNQVLSMYDPFGLVSPVVMQGNMLFQKHWRYVQQIATQFWNRWIKEYLPELQRRQKWNDDVRDVKVGDLVLIMNENSPRGSWPMGIVIDTSAGRDGHVRSAMIMTKTTQLVRPITKLVFLEGSCYDYSS